jgi:hypothetical protein
MQGEVPKPKRYNKETASADCCKVLLPLIPHREGLHGALGFKKIWEANSGWGCAKSVIKTNCGKVWFLSNLAAAAAVPRQWLVR